MSASPITIRVAGATDVGRTRAHNEDSFLVADLTSGDVARDAAHATYQVGPHGALFMVADGMGGAAAGEIASEMATNIVLEELQSGWVASDQQDPEAFASAIKRATASANQQINRYATEHPEYRGMGTTATIAGLLGDTLYVAQVGDSRAYLVRGGVARQITKDQSLIQKLVEAGELTEEEAELSERRNIILQALGPDANVKVDLTHQSVRRGDLLVLCSDGLSGQVRAEEIADVALGTADLVQVCASLVALANERGGPDNITVVAVRFDGDGLHQANDADVVGHRVYPFTDSGQVPAARAEDAAEEHRRPTVPIAVIDEPMPLTPTSDGSPATRAAVPLPSEATRADALRRGRGRTLSIFLLGLLVAGGAWFVLRALGRLGTAP